MRAQQEGEPQQAPQVAQAAPRHANGCIRHDMEGGHDSPLLGLGWAASLAGSLVHPSPLPQDAACALQEAFPGQTVM